MTVFLLLLCGEMPQAEMMTRAGPVGGRDSGSLQSLLLLALGPRTVSRSQRFFVYKIRVSSIGLRLVIWFNHETGLDYIVLKEFINMTSLTGPLFYRAG